MEEVAQKSWFKRNWKWFVPTVGCGTLLLLAILGIVALFYGVTNFITESTPAQYAIKKASENTVVIEALGTPIEQKGLVNGELNYSNGLGSADLALPIKGPDGRATVYVVGKKIVNEWIYTEMYVWIRGSNETVNLLEKPKDSLESP